MKQSELKISDSVESYDEKTAEIYRNCYVAEKRTVSKLSKISIPSFDSTNRRLEWRLNQKNSPCCLESQRGDSWQRDLLGSILKWIDSVLKYNNSKTFRVRKKNTNIIRKVRIYFNYQSISMHSGYSFFQYQNNFSLLANIMQRTAEHIHWENYISMSFHSEWDMIVVMALEPNGISIWFKNCHHDHILFTV